MKIPKELRRRLKEYPATIKRLEAVYGKPDLPAGYEPKQVDFYKNGSHNIRWVAPNLITHEGISVIHLAPNIKETVIDEELVELVINKGERFVFSRLKNDIKMPELNRARRVWEMGLSETEENIEIKEIIQEKIIVKVPEEIRIKLKDYPDTLARLEAVYDKPDLPAGYEPKQLDCYDDEVHKFQWIAPNLITHELKHFTSFKPIVKELMVDGELVSIYLKGEDILFNRLTEEVDMPDFDETKRVWEVEVKEIFQETIIVKVPEEIRIKLEDYPGTLARLEAVYDKPDLPEGYEPKQLDFYEDHVHMLQWLAPDLVTHEVEKIADIVVIVNEVIVDGELVSIYMKEEGFIFSRLKTTNIKMPDIAGARRIREINSSGRG